MYFFYLVSNIGNYIGDTISLWRNCDLIT